MVDAADLKSATSWRCVGSNPSLGTNLSIEVDHKPKGVINKKRIGRIGPILLDKCWTNSQQRTVADHNPQLSKP